MAFRRFERSTSVGAFTLTTCLDCDQAVASSTDPVVLESAERVHVCTERHFDPSEPAEQATEIAVIRA